MPSIEELKARLEQLREAVAQKLPDIALTMAITAKSLSERNIRERGFGAKYSENKVPAWWFLGKELNGSGTSYLQSLTAPKASKGKKKIEDITEADLVDGETTWGDFREAQGLQKMFVDLGYTNKMWADMSPVEVAQQGDGRVVAFLGGRTRENQDKMNYNRDRYGDFISKGLGEQGRDLLGQVLIDEVVSVMEQFKLT